MLNTYMFRNSYITTPVVIDNHGSGYLGMAGCFNVH